MCSILGVDDYPKSGKSEGKKRGSERDHTGQRGLRNSEESLRILIISSEIATHHTRVYRSTALHDFIASTLEHPNLPIATPKVSFIATPIFQH